MTDPDGLIGRLLAYEAEISYRLPPPVDELEFTYQGGQRPILFSAPHGAAHTRNGRIKGEDEYTAGLARLVAELSGAHTLYAHHLADTDPNYDPETPYKECLNWLVRAARIQFVVDIHGADPKRPFGLALGTIDGQSCPDQFDLIIRTLAEYGFTEDSPEPLDRLDVDQTFPGGRKQHTVTAYVSQTLGVPAAQFEINARLRTVKNFKDGSSSRLFRGDLSRIMRTIKMFVALTQVLVGS